MTEYIFIGKSLFFPVEGILVIGDLHIGYEAMLRQSGVLVPARQVKDIIDDFSKIFNEIRKQNLELKKIVFIGDIKHAFGFDSTEKNEFQEVLGFLREYIPRESVILIKGNHDTIDYTFEGLMKDFYIYEGILFLHGHKKIKEIRSKEIKTIVFGHIHPCILFEESAKKEAYKCFLIGKCYGKDVIVMPSFLGFVEGTPINNYREEYIETFSIIPKKDVMNFEVHAVGDDKIYEFGRVKNHQR